MEDSNLVPKYVTYADGTTCTTPQRQERVAVAPQKDSDSSTVAKVRTDGMLLIRGRLKMQDISERACEIILSSWRKGTRKQYIVYFYKWTKHASQRNHDPSTPTVANVIDSGMGYSAINSA